MKNIETVVVGPKLFDKLIPSSNAYSRLLLLVLLMGVESLQGNDEYTALSEPQGVIQNYSAPAEGGEAEDILKELYDAEEVESVGDVTIPEGFEDTGLYNRDNIYNCGLEYDSNGSEGIYVMRVAPNNRILDTNYSAEFISRLNEFFLVNNVHKESLKFEVSSGFNNATDMIPIVRLQVSFKIDKTPNLGTEYVGEIVGNTVFGEKAECDAAIVRGYTTRMKNHPRGNRAQYGGGNMNTTDMVHASNGLGGYKYTTYNGDSIFARADFAVVPKESPASNAQAGQIDVVSQNAFSDGIEKKPISLPRITINNPKLGREAIPLPTMSRVFWIDQNKTEARVFANEMPSGNDQYLVPNYQDEYYSANFDAIYGAYPKTGIVVAAAMSYRDRGIDDRRNIKGKAYINGEEISKTGRDEENGNIPLAQEKWHNSTIVIIDANGKMTQTHYAEIVSTFGSFSNFEQSIQSNKRSVYQTPSVFRSGNYNESLADDKSTFHRSMITMSDGRIAIIETEYATRVSSYGVAHQLTQGISGVERIGYMDTGRVKTGSYADAHGGTSNSGYVHLLQIGGK